MYTAGARYREFAPRLELREFVRAFFTFTAPAEEGPARRLVTCDAIFRDGELTYSPLFADGHLSIVFTFGPSYHVDGLWSPGPSGHCGHVIGAMSAARSATHGERVVQVGAYLRAAQARRFTSVPACELTDRIVALDELWGSGAVTLETRLREASEDAERVSLLETALLSRMKGESNQVNLDLAGMAECVRVYEGRITVEQLANDAGISRQHLTRVFREEVGVTPKLYCRLARFRAGLAYANGRARKDWADVSAHLGYTDQSHLIAEFREFTGLTPWRMTMEQRFHPFMNGAEDHLPR